MIVYHVNSLDRMMDEGNDYIIDVELKSLDDFKHDIEMLILEGGEEYLEQLKIQALEENSIDEVRKRACDAVSKRLKLNRDKTFGLGRYQELSQKANIIEKLFISGIVEVYGQSKSTSRLSEDDIVTQIINDYKNHKNELTSENVIELMYSGSCCDMNIHNLVDELAEEMLALLSRFNQDYGVKAETGKTFSLQVQSQDDSTAATVSNIFSNKLKIKENDFYSIDFLVKSADIYFKVPDLSTERELIFIDSVGLNQGQKESSRLKEIVNNRVHDAIQRRKPDIIIYHTRLNTNDDYLLDVIKDLNMQGYGKKLSVVAGRLDTVIKDYMEGNDIELDECTEEEFIQILDDIQNLYVESDKVTLKTIIGDQYYLCDKADALSKTIKKAREYTCRNVFEKILNSYIEVPEVNCEALVETKFFDFLSQSSVCAHAYTKFKSHISDMVPMEYSRMRWNTLQKAIECLYYNEYGFDLMYPALKLKRFLAESMSTEENNKVMQEIFQDDAEEIKRNFLIEFTETAQIVMVTAYRGFMLRLIRMRYDTNLRTNLNTTMTNDRKYNLIALFQTCLEKDMLSGDMTLQLIAQIAWRHMMK